LGIDHGVYTVPDDFDAPLPDDVLESFHQAADYRCAITGLTPDVR
jgi:hypothetical protein